MALSTRADSASSVASGFSIKRLTPRSTAARMGSTCRCSSVAMTAAVTSGRLKSSWKSVETNSPHPRGDLLAPIGARLGDADPTHARVLRGNLAADQADPSRPHDREANPLLCSPGRHGQRLLERRGDG